MPDLSNLRLVRILHPIGDAGWLGYPQEGDGAGAPEDLMVAKVKTTDGLSTLDLMAICGSELSPLINHIKQYS